MGILTHSPLAGGWVSGSWSTDSSRTSSAQQRLAARLDDMSLPDNQRKLDAVRQLSQLAKGAGVSMIELPLTSAPVGDRSCRVAWWLLHKAGSVRGG
jgi:aryl-alcohol dehydrogenase-like predicted oxidoreductase